LILLDFTSYRLILATILMAQFIRAYQHRLNKEEFATAMDDLDDNEIEALCIELAKQGHRVKGILTELRRIIGSKRVDRRDIIKEERSALRHWRKEQKEERKQQRQQQLAQQRAGMKPEALANLQNSIASLAEQTKEERRQQDKLAVVQRKQDMAGKLRNRVNGSGDADRC
jgi:hypothetical protein